MKGKRGRGKRRGGCGRDGKIMEWRTGKGKNGKEGQEVVRERKRCSEGRVGEEGDAVGEEEEEEGVGSPLDSRLL